MYPIITENDTVRVTEMYVPMSDGVKLYTRFASPKGKDKCPIVFIRTPYEKAHNQSPHNIALYDDDEYIKHGYGVVLQHVRGRGDSEGKCIPYVEREDGLTTLDFIRTLPFYNGEIYLYGRSYLSTVHLCYLNTKPQDIKGAVFDIQTDRMYFRNYRNGCCYDFCKIDWWASMMKRTYPNYNLDGTLTMPYKDVAKRVFGEDVPEYTALLLNDTNNDFWKNDPRENVVDSLNFPILFRDGWYDYYTLGMFDMWRRLPEKVKEKSAFVVGPWGHDTRVSEKAALPMENGNLPTDHAVEWFDSIREKRDYRYAERGRVHYHSMGGDKWNTALYPQKNKDTLKLFFSQYRTLKKESRDGEISYRYDPQKKNKLFEYGTIYEAAPMGAREDIISFISDEISEDTDFFGNIRWHMKVSSSCDDTAFFMRVHFVRDGKAYNLTETITSLTHITPDYKRGGITVIDLETPPIGFTLKKGDKIRVDISSNGSIYVPHSNLKCHWAKAPKTRIATNTIYMNDAFIEIQKRKGD